MAFNNGETQRFSEVIEIEPPVDEDGNYSFTIGTAFGPSEPLWIYSDKESDFYSMHLGHCQRLPNGNTFIVESEDNGNMLEVTQSGEKVWEFSPGFQVAKAHRYDTDYPGLSKLISGNISKQVFKEKKLSIYTYPNPCKEQTIIYLNKLENSANVKIFSINGKIILSRTIKDNSLKWDTGYRPCGIYVLKVEIEDEIYVDYINLVR